MKKLKVVVLDDRPICREGLAAVVARDPRFEIVGTVSDCDAAEALIARAQVDVVVMSCALQINDIYSLMDRNVALVQLSDAGNTARVKHIMRAGVRGYVLQSSSSDILLQAIAAVATGDCFIDPGSGMLDPHSITPEMAEEGNEYRNPRIRLTERETAVLQLLAMGYSTKEIARKLSIGPKSVATYKRRGFHKLNLNSRAQLFHFAKGCGWLAESVL